MYVFIKPVTSRAINSFPTRRSPDLMSEVGLTPETRQGHWDENEPIQGHTGQLVEVLHYWENERHAILVNRKAVAYDGPNPYWRHGKKPFVVQSFEPLPNQFYGM